MIVSPLHCACQNNKAVKLNAQFVPIEGIKPWYVGFDDPVFRWVSPSFSWAEKSGKLGYEIGVQYFRKDHESETDPEYSHEYEIAFMYDFYRIKPSYSKLDYIFVYSSRIFYYHGNENITISTESPIEYVNPGISFSGKPRVRYDINDRLFLETSVEFIVLSVSLEHRNIHNPTLTRRQRVSAHLDFNLSLIGRMYLSIGYLIKPMRSN